MSATPALPRRARKISDMANAIAADRLRVLSLRQAVSDRIGYTVAVAFGALATWASWWAVGLLLVGYVIAAVVAYRRYQRALEGMA